MLSANQQLLNRAWHRAVTMNALALLGILAIVLAVGVMRKLTQDRQGGAATGFDTIWASRIEPTISPGTGLASEPLRPVQPPAL